MFKDILRVGLFFSLFVVLMVNVGSCMMKDNLQTRKEQMAECKAAGGRYIISMTSNPNKDSCSL